MNITLNLRADQTAGLSNVTAKANVGSPSPLTDEQFLTASVIGLLDGWAETAANERKTKAAETFADQPIAVQEALLTTDDWSGIIS
ncbi:MAG: hypothetical protein WCL08_00255 [Verrucomicrobiota bacterium]